jgi:hypothetical protein
MGLGEIDPKSAIVWMWEELRKNKRLENDGDLCLAALLHPIMVVTSIHELNVPHLLSKCILCIVRLRS